MFHSKIFKLFYLSIILVFTGCGNTDSGFVPNFGSSDSTLDSASDSNNPYDTSYDTTVDSSMDSSNDTGSDTNPDTASDSTIDTASDSTVDTGSDSTVDTGSDTTVDTDTSSDSAADSDTTPVVCNDSNSTVISTTAWTAIPVQAAGETACFKIMVEDWVYKTLNIKVQNNLHNVVGNAVVTGTDSFYRTFNMTTYAAQTAYMDIQQGNTAWDNPSPNPHHVPYYVAITGSTEAQDIDYELITDTDTGSDSDTGADSDTGSDSDTGADSDTGSDSDTGADSDTVVCDDSNSTVITTTAWTSIPVQTAGEVACFKIDVPDWVYMTLNIKIQNNLHNVIGNAVVTGTDGFSRSFDITTYAAQTAYMDIQQGNTAYDDPNPDKHHAPYYVAITGSTEAQDIDYELISK